jgi:hypothetical protein
MRKHNCLQTAAKVFEQRAQQALQQGGRETCNTNRLFPRQAALKQQTILGKQQTTSHLSPA